MRHPVQLKRFHMAVILVALVGLLLPTAATARSHDCTFCHGLHGTALVPAADQVETLCLNCHGAAGVSTLKADVHKNQPGKGQSPPRFTFNFTCTDCHNPHEGESFVNWEGNSNIKMVGRTDLDGGSGVTEVLIPNTTSSPNPGIRNIVFSELIGPNGGAWDVLDQNGQRDRACETCHSDPQLGHHTNELCTPDATGSCGDHTHNISKRCISCHNHDNFFWK